MFEFLDFNRMTDGELDLWLARTVEPNEKRGHLAAYEFRIARHNIPEKIGEIDIRIGHNENSYYGGNIGYGILEEFRGHGYAAKACRIVKRVALAHGMAKLIITCNPDNWPSRRTCEKLGLMLKEIVDLPTHNDMYLLGERQKCIYEWILEVR